MYSRGGILALYIWLGFARTICADLQHRRYTSPCRSSGHTVPGAQRNLLLLYTFAWATLCTKNLHRFSSYVVVTRRALWQRTKKVQRLSKLVLPLLERPLERVHEPSRLLMKRCHCYVINTAIAIELLELADYVRHPVISTERFRHSKPGKDSDHNANRG